MILVFRMWLYWLANTFYDALNTKNKRSENLYFQHILGIHFQLAATL